MSVVQLAATRVDSGSFCVMGTFTVVLVVHCRYLSRNQGEGRVWVGGFFYYNPVLFRLLN